MSATETRFGFGENWQRFATQIDARRIAEADRSLQEMLGVESLEGQRLLDIGCGSGLFSLAACRLGAEVHSFDYDPDSVACTQSVAERHGPADARWTIERGDVLDTDYVASLGTFDIVYSWGVLHHTGNIWGALKNAATPVRPGGRLFIAIYRDQGWLSSFWTGVKRTYNAGFAGKALVTGVFVPFFAAEAFLGDVARLRSPMTTYREYAKNRGMSKVTDWLDWLGGYPFEVASAQQLVDFYAPLGFTPETVRELPRGHGNNELVFQRAG